MPIPINLQSPTASVCPDSARLRCLSVRRGPLTLRACGVSPALFCCYNNETRINRICGRPLCQRGSNRPKPVPRAPAGGGQDYAVQVYERNQARYTALLRREIENATRLKRVLAAFGIHEPNSFPLVVTPPGRAAAAEQRKEVFRGTVLVEQVRPVLSARRTAGAPHRRGREPEPLRPDGTETSLRALPGFLLSRGGGNHAYLDVGALARLSGGASGTGRFRRDRLPGPRGFPDLSGLLSLSPGRWLRDFASGDAFGSLQPVFSQALLGYCDLPVSGPVRGFLVTADYGELHRHLDS